MNNLKTFEEFDWKFGFGNKSNKDVPDTDFRMKEGPEKSNMKNVTSPRPNVEPVTQSSKVYGDDKLFKSMMDTIYSEFDPNKLKWDILEGSADGEHEDTYGYIYSIEDDELGVTDDGFVMVNNEDMDVDSRLAKGTFNFFDTEYKKNKAGAKATSKEQLKKKYIKKWHEMDPGPDW